MRLRFALVGIRCVSVIKWHVWRAWRVCTLSCCGFTHKLIDSSLSCFQRCSCSHSFSCEISALWVPNLSFSYEISALWVPSSSFSWESRALWVRNPCFSWEISALRVPNPSFSWVETDKLDTDRPVPTLTSAAVQTSMPPAPPAAELEDWAVAERSVLPHHPVHLKSIAWLSMTQTMQGYLETLSSALPETVKSVDSAVISRFNGCHWDKSERPVWCRSRAPHFFECACATTVHTCFTTCYFEAHSCKLTSAALRSGETNLVQLEGISIEKGLRNICLFSSHFSVLKVLCLRGERLLAKRPLHKKGPVLKPHAELDRINFPLPDISMQPHSAGSQAGRLSLFRPHYSLTRAESSILIWTANRRPLQTGTKPPKWHVVPQFRALFVKNRPP